MVNLDEFLNVSYFTYIFEIILVFDVLSDEPGVLYRLLHVVGADLVEGGTGVAGAVQGVRPAAGRTVELLVTPWQRDGGEMGVPEAGAHSTRRRHVEPNKKVVLSLLG